MYPLLIGFYLPQSVGSKDGMLFVEGAKEFYAKSKGEAKKLHGKKKR
jgi:hypothetical protein